jgi:hypothetical protein
LSRVHQIWCRLSAGQERALMLQQTSGGACTSMGFAAHWGAPLHKGYGDKADHMSRIGCSHTSTPHHLAQLGPYMSSNQVWDLARYRNLGLLLLLVEDRIVLLQRAFLEPWEHFPGVELHSLPFNVPTVKIFCYEVY